MLKTRTKTIPLGPLLFAGVASNILGISAPQIAVAQTTALEEVIVTARKREESLQDTPISVVAFSNQDIEARGMVDFSELGEFTPNVTFDYTAAIAGGNSAAIVTIRGIGSSDWALPVDPGVGIYLDGVYIARTIGQVMDTVDVERIEVLRGPQGTLFGRNTIGGAISVVTKKPTTEELFGRAEITTGSYNRLDGSAFINLPLTDELATSLSLSSRKRDGFVKNLAAGAPDLGDNEDLSSRLAFRWTPSDNVILDIAGDYSKTNEAPAPNVLIDIIESGPLEGFTPFNNGLLSGNPAQCTNLNDPGRLSNPACLNRQFALGPFRTLSPHRSQTPELQTDEFFGLAVRPASELTTWGVGGTLEWEINDSLTFKSITAHRRVEDGFWSRDATHSPNPNHILARTANLYEQRQTSLEFQLLGTALDDRLNYIVGLFYLEEEGEHLDVVELPVNTVFDSGGEIDNTSQAIFAQATYDVTEQLALTLGIRYTDEQKEFVALSVVGLDRSNPELGGDGLVTGLPDCLNNPIPLPGDGACVLPPDPVNSDATETEPYFNLAYQWTDQIMTYATYSEGFKGGAFTQRVFPPALETPSAGPEFVTAYEVGFKTTLLDSRLRLNGAVFFTDYEDLQVNVNAATGTGGGAIIGTVTDNAAQAEIKGFELELTAVPTPQALVQLSVGFLDAEYVEIDDTVNEITLDSDLVDTPDWNVTAAAQYEFDLGGMGTLTPRVDLSYVSEVANTANNTEALVQDSYALVNVSLTWRDSEDLWSATLGGKNVTDEEYLVTGFSGSGIIEGVYGLPSTWSLAVRRNFR